MSEASGISLPECMLAEVKYRAGEERNSAGTGETGERKKSSRLIHIKIGKIKLTVVESSSRTHMQEEEIPGFLCMCFKHGQSKENHLVFLHGLHRPTKETDGGHWFSVFLACYSARVRLGEGGGIGKAMSFQFGGEERKGFCLPVRGRKGRHSVL